MSDFTADLLNSNFSPSLVRARTLSRIMAVLFVLGFLVMLSVALSAVVFVFFPKNLHGVGFGIGLPPGPIVVGFGDMHGWSAVGAATSSARTAPRRDNGRATGGDPARPGTWHAPAR